MSKTSLWKPYVFIWIKEKILSTSRSQITPHGNKTFTNPATEIPQQSLLSCANTAPPGLHAGVNCCYSVHCPVPSPQSQQSHFGTLILPIFNLFIIKAQLSTGRCKESQVRAVTLHFHCSAFIPACGGSRNSPWFPGSLANTAFTSKRSF